MKDSNQEEVIKKRIQEERDRLKKQEEERAN